MQSDRHRLTLEEFQAYIRRLANGAFHPKTCALYFVVAEDRPGTDIPSGLPKLYNRYVTLCLQHQFWDVTCDNLGFSVMLNFNRQPYKVRVPWGALVNYYVVGDKLPAAELVPVPANDRTAKVVRVDFQAKRVL